MTLEHDPGKVIFVDDHEAIRQVLANEAEMAGLSDFEIYEEAPETVARIQELDEPAAAVFSDGLNGGWKEVIRAAQEARIPAFVVSASPNIEHEVREANATFLLKSDITAGFIEIALRELQASRD